MKKLLFTALAVVAFSGVAMAGSLEVKEGKKENEKKRNEKKEVVLKADSCESSAADQLDREDPCNDLSATEAGERYRELVEFCEYMLA